jgi:hypothetical protein
MMMAADNNTQQPSNTTHQTTKTKQQNNNIKNKQAETRPPNTGTQKHRSTQPTQHKAKAARDPANTQTNKQTHKQTHTNTRHRQSQRQVVGQPAVYHLWGVPPQGSLQCKQQADELTTGHRSAATTTKGHNTTRTQNHTDKEPQQQNNGTETQGHKDTETQRSRTTTGQSDRQMQKVTTKWPPDAKSDLHGRYSGAAIQADPVHGGQSKG